jgi:catechol 2,3-dioxygenase-like lactoylglutathione lyase family enzyme
MLKDGKVMAFLATRDGGRARTFYETTLGLQVISDDDFALAVDTGGTMLRIQKVASFAPHPFTALGWEVRDIATAVGNLAAAGVICERFPGLGQDEKNVWQAPSGARVAWFKDPDGNLLSLTQM